jgi:hypothetical protein
MIATHVKTSIHEADPMNLPLKANRRNTLDFGFTPSFCGYLIYTLKAKLRSIRRSFALTMCERR